jgi:hypothetical protein
MKSAIETTYLDYIMIIKEFKKAFLWRRKIFPNFQATTNGPLAFCPSLLFDSYF